jgi:hypothetical protein
MFKKVLKLQPLPHYLPFQFRNGVIIRQFSKPCLRCNEILHSQHMYGLIRPIDNYAALAAQAKCPVCKLQFNIACIINDQKEVRRVLLPTLLFRWYLQILPSTARMPAPSQNTHEAAQPFASPSSPVPSPLPADTASAPSFHFDRSEEAIGHYNGKPIPAYIIMDNEPIPFARVAAANPQLKAGEYLIDGYLIYSKSAL